MIVHFGMKGVGRELITTNVSRFFFGELSDTVKQYDEEILSPQISYGVCTGTGTARSPAVQNSSLKRLPTISADNLYFTIHY